VTVEDFTTEDISEMRRQGDMRSFMRQQYRPIRKTVPAPPAAVAPRPGHIVGAWPIAAPTGEPAVVCSCAACVQLHHNPKPDGFDPLA